MRFGSVNYEKKGKIAILTLDEPSKLNALSAGIRQGIREGVKAAEEDDQIRVIVFTGGSGRAFCAGADISGFDFSPEATQKFMDDVLGVLAIGETCAKPVISAVNGLALGGGFELAIGSDIVIASDKAKFGVPEVDLGLLPGFAIVRLKEIVGRQKAKELSLTGEPISAEEAVRLRIATRVVPHDDLMKETMALAEKIASKPRLTVALGKAAYNRGLGGEEMAYAKAAMPFLFATEDTREGVTAFLEKRKPVFKD